jgi:alkylation response protein AidB-like acyl-CoA dehydrogenase
VAAPVEYGGTGLAFPDFLTVVETLVGGCLSTAFTWMQHHSAVLGLVSTDNVALREEYLPGLVSGRVRAGVAFAGAIPQPPRLWARRVAGGFVLTGEAPFVSGWDSIDTLLISARESDTGSTDTIVSGLVDARATGGPSVRRLRLVAAQGSATVRLTFTDQFLPLERVTRLITREKFLMGQEFGSRVNASVPLGIAGRCLRLLAEAGHDEPAEAFGTQLAATRRQLDAALAEPDAMPAARAAAAELAYRIAGTTVAAFGSAAITEPHPAQRLAREAMFALVAAGRPEIKAGLVDLFGHAPAVGTPR